MIKKDTSDKDLKNNQNVLRNLLVKLNIKNRACGALKTNSKPLEIEKNIIDMDNYLTLFNSLDSQSQLLHRPIVINMSKFILAKLEYVIDNNSNSTVLHTFKVNSKFNKLRTNYYATMFNESLH